MGLPLVPGTKCGILGQVWYLLASIPDLCNLSYFNLTVKFEQLLESE